MGKGIVYCQDCGKSLREEMFEQGKAHTVDDRPYCIACRAPDPTPPTGTYPKAAPRTGRAAPPALSARRSSPVLPSVPAGKANPHLPILIGAALAGVAFVVLLVVLLSGGREPTKAEAPEPPPAARKDPAREEYEKLRAFAAGSQDPDAILLKCDEAKVRLKGTPWLDKIAEIERRAVALKEDLRKTGRLDTFLKEIRSLADQDREFQKRVEVEGMLDSARKIAGPREAEVEGLRAELRRAFDAASQKALAEAKAQVARLQAEEKFAEAAAAIEKLPAAFLALPGGAPLAALRPELERKAEEQEKSARVWAEGEDLKVLQAAGTVQAQDMKALGSWSNGNHLWWRDAKPGDVLRLEFPSNVAGRRRLVLALTKAPDYGIVRISVNGGVIAESIDLYNPGKVVPSGELSWEVDLKKGPNELKAEIRGTNPAASPANHMFGLDYLRIE